MEVAGDLVTKLVDTSLAHMSCNASFASDVPFANSTTLGAAGAPAFVSPWSSALALAVLFFNGGSGVMFAAFEYLSRLFMVFEAFILFVVLTSYKSDEDEVPADPNNAVSKEPEKKWVIFGEVYDLTPWLDRHPGGALVLQQSMGTDCSATFASAHTFNGGRLVKVLEKYWARHAEAHEMDVSSKFHWASTPAHDQMRAQLRDHFKGRSIKAPSWVLAWYAMWLGVLLVATWRWLVTGHLPTALLLGVAIWYSSVDVVHCGMHFAIFESPKANLWLAYVFGMWSYLPSSWIRQHNMLHHTHTNHEEDPDLHHFHYFDDIVSVWFERYLGFYPFGGWRLSECTQMKSRYTRWLMMFPIYFFSSGLALSIVEPPILYITKRCLGSKQRFEFPTWELVVAWVQYVIVVSTICTVAWFHGALAALLPLFTFGLFFYMFTQVSHANEASNGVDDDSAEWAVAQVRSTRGDYSYESKFWNAISGGLHLQSVHHVFPSVHWAHYPSIYHIIWGAAGEKRAPQNFADVVRSHFTFVARLNRIEE